MTKKLIKKLFIPTVLYGGLLVFLFSTNPRNLPIGWLLVPFLWLFVALFWTFMRILPRLSSERRPKRVLLTSVFGAMLPTLALLLDSVNQLTLRDAVLLVGFGMLGFFYASRINFGR
jgi:hypothetical protein